MKNTFAFRTASLAFVAVLAASACSSADATDADVEPPLFDPAAAADADLDDPFDLVEVTIDEIGVSTVAPSSWTRNPGGGFSDGVSEFGFFVVPTNMASDPTGDGFEPIDGITEGGHDWHRYLLDGGEVTQGLALTEIGDSTYGLVLHAPRDLAEQYLDHIVTPALAAFEADERPAADAIDSASIDVNGHTVAYTAAGTGPMTVVFEAGLGNGMSSWSLVAAAVAEEAQVFAYDRPGYGGSDLTDTPRDGATMVAELRDLLIQTGHEPPFVLVGHSLGGTLMDLFARTFPDDVAGAVLVDSRHHEFSARCLARFDTTVCDVPADAEVEALPEPIRSEWMGAADTVREIAAAPSFPDVPLAVIVAGIAESAPGYVEIWRETQQDYADMVAGSRLLVAERSDHGIPAQQPEIVIDAIVEILQGAF